MLCQGDPRLAQRAVGVSETSKSFMMCVMRILGCSCVRATSKGDRQLTVYMADVSGEFLFVMWDTEENLQAVQDRLQSDTVALITDLTPNLWNCFLSFKLRPGSKIYIVGEQDEIAGAAMPPPMMLNEFIFTDMSDIGAADRVEMHVCVYARLERVEQHRPREWLCAT